MVRSFHVLQCHFFSFRLSIDSLFLPSFPLNLATVVSNDSPGFRFKEPMPKMDAHRSCGCLTALANVMAPIQNESVVTFENVLTVTQGVMDQWGKSIHGCTKCLSDHETIANLAMVTRRLFMLLKAACLAYSILEGDFGLEDSTADTLPITSLQTKSEIQQPDHVTDLGPAPWSQQVICIQSPMTLGQLKLDGSESKLLAEQLLVDELSKLNSMLEDLKDVAGDQWSGTGSAWNQVSKGLLATDTLISRTMESSVTLIGRIKSSRRSSGSADSAFGPTL